MRDGKKFVTLALCSLGCSSAYTLLQERGFRHSDFHSSGLLTNLTFTVHAICGAVELLYRGLHRQRVGLVKVYLLLGMLTAVSSYASNYGLRSVPYPVKIICKSCKIIPVMAAGMLLQKRQYKRQEMYAALTMSIGVALFLLGSLSDIPLATGIWGVALLLASLCLDAAVANLEEKLLFRCAVPVSRPEAMAYMSASATFFSFLFVGFTGEIREVTSGGLQHLGMWLGFVGSAVAGYVALGMILLLVKTFGVADAEMVKTFGKVVQVGTSFMIFPKPLHVWNILGGALAALSLVAFFRDTPEGTKHRESPKTRLKGIDGPFSVPTRGELGEPSVTQRSLALDTVQLDIGQDIYLQSYQSALR